MAESQKNADNYNSIDSTKGPSPSSLAEEVIPKKSTFNNIDGTRSNNMWKNITRMKQRQNIISNNEEE